MKIKQSSNTAWLVLFACATLALAHCSKGDNPGPEPISDEAAVMQAKDRLEIGYSGTDTAMSVTENVTLPTTGADGVVISWMSSDPSIISTDGTVTRPTDMDTDVHLTATLTKGDASDTKTFTLTAIIPDADPDTIAVRNAKNALAITYSGTDTAMNVTGNVTLPTTGADEVVISWMSSDTSIISTEGTVTRPTDMDTMVRLTATLSKNAAMGMRTFDLVVIITDAGADTIAVRDAKNALEIGYSGTDTAISVTENVTLPTAGADGVVISWMSSDPSIISTEGTVTRPTDMDTDVRLTATLTRGGASDTKTFTLAAIIPDADPDTIAVRNAKNALAITYSGTDTAMNVTGNVTLPTTGADEVVISWMSSDTSIVSTEGTVTRPTDMDTMVRLTATLSKNAAMSMRTFDLVVSITDEAAVMQAKDSLAITYSGTDTALSVTGNVTLPTTGANGVVISWMSSDTGIISTAGVVTRPTDIDTEVHLTATLTRGDASDMKTFTLTAIIAGADADTIAVRNAKNALEIGYSGTDTAMNVTGNVTLPTTGANGVVISWMSGDTSIVSTDGTVTRPTDTNTMVRLTATLSKNAAIGMRTFDLVVIITDKAAVIQAAASLSRRIGYSGTDTTLGVTENLTLPTTGANGVVISWMSGDTSIVSTDGTVTRPTDMNRLVRLTAILSKNENTPRVAFTVHIVVLATDEVVVMRATDNLKIGYRGTDTAMSVTENLTLPTTGADGVVISWMSSDTDIINTDGTITRPTDMDTMVTLTATLSRGDAADQTKTFDLVVAVSITDEAAVRNAKDSLVIGYRGTDTAMSVTRNLTLPAIGADGVRIVWMSSDTGIISTNGRVTRPTDMDTDVTLTAGLFKGGSASDTKEFMLTVIIGTDSAVNIAKTNLAIGYSGTDDATGVTANIKLPTAGANGVAVAWAETSDDSDAIAIAETADGDGNLLGTITRPSSMDTMVTLTATLSKRMGTEMASVTKEFMLTILAPPATNAIAVMRAKDRLQITYSSGDSDAGVRGDLTLPSAELDEVMISWAAEPTGIVSTAEATLGEVTRPSSGMDTMVTLTATLTKGTGTEMASDTKEFMFTVLADDPKLIDIESVAQLIAMRHDPDGNGMVTGANQSAYEAAFPGLDTTIEWEGYELVADLDLSGNTWTPQPSTTATFAGNGFIISNVTITVTSDVGGFFANIKTGGHVRNLHLENINYNGRCCMGAIAGKVHSGGSVTGSSSSGTLTTTQWFAGGLVGQNSGTIIASSSSVTVSGGQNETGGLVGANFGTIVASYATGNVAGDGRSVGGLVGSNEDNTGTVVACYATGTVTADDTHSDSGFHGGLMGRNKGGKVIASYATGNVNGADHNGVGGLVGRNETGGTITASYSTGTPTSTGSDIGGLVGDNDGTVTASYFDSTTSGITTGTGAQATSALQTPTEYGTDPAIYSGWNIDVDNGFTRGVDDGSAAGDTTADDPWDFGTASQYPALKVDFDGDGTAGVAEFGSQR